VPRGQRDGSLRSYSRLSYVLIVSICLNYTSIFFLISLLFTLSIKYTFIDRVAKTGLNSGPAALIPVSRPNGEESDRSRPLNVTLQRRDLT
jgi:hypothetical protein